MYLNRYANVFKNYEQYVKQLMIIQAFLYLTRNLRNGCNESVSELISLKAITYCSVLLYVRMAYNVCAHGGGGEGGRAKGIAREKEQSVRIAPRALHMCRRVQKSGEKCNLKAGELHSQSSTDSQPPASSSYSAPFS